jgi:hypothetical protein
MGLDYFSGVTLAELAHDAYPVPNRNAFVVLQLPPACVLPPTPLSRSSHRTVSASATRFKSALISTISSHTILRVPCTRLLGERSEAN